MLASRPIRILTTVLLSAALAPTAPLAFAQPKPATPPIAAPANPPSDDELIAIREQLIALLRMSPTLTNVVETDPSLLADQEYVSRTNPQLAQFLAQHPEVTRNPDFYLFAEFPELHGKRTAGLRRRVNGNEPPSEEPLQYQVRREYMADLMGTLAFVGVVGTLLWLIRILLENRRWNRVFRLQSEIHAKLIDRFANNQELLHYMETEPGKRFLEAAPIPVGFERGQRMPGGLARIVGPLQTGIVLALLGLGMFLVHPLFMIGIIALALGLGFIISAIVSWRISERLGLLPNQPTPTDDMP